MAPSTTNGRVPWNETIVQQARYTSDRYADYPLDFATEAAEVEQPMARAKTIRVIMRQLEAYARFLELQAVTKTPKRP